MKKSFEFLFWQWWIGWRKDSCTPSSLPSYSHTWGCKLDIRSTVTFNTVKNTTETTFLRNAGPCVTRIAISRGSVMLPLKFRTFSWSRNLQPDMSLPLKAALPATSTECQFLAREYITEIMIMMMMMISIRYSPSTKWCSQVKQS